MEIANLSVIGGVNRRLRRAGPGWPADLEDLDALMAGERPRVAARFRSVDAPFCAAGGQLCLGFRIDPDVLAEAASRAVAAYCGETTPPTHRAFRPLGDLGLLSLGHIVPFSGADASMYARPGFESPDDEQAFCADPSGYLQDLSGIHWPEHLELGPMRVVPAPASAPVGHAQPGRLMARTGQR